ncbi:MAG TPA: Uma2 family endonuclease [Polyangia bacterium]|jgi:Uma2 family endonuclease
MRDPPRRRATYDDLLRLPEHVVGEIIDGELIVSPRPAPRHAQAASVLGGDLGPPFHRGRGGPGGWWILDEPELHFGDQVLVPDLAGWRRARLPALPETAYFEVAPDWVCEVISPSTTTVDRARKLPIYAHERVGHIWLVDPLARSLEVFRWTEAGWLLAAVHHDDEQVRAEPFAAVELEIGGWWTGLAETKSEG